MMDALLAKAAKKCDQAELFHEDSRSLSTWSSLDRIECSERENDAGFGLRVVKGGRVGFAFFTRERDADRAIREAIASAKVAHPESYSLPAPSRSIKRKNFDKRVAGLTEERAIDLLLGMIQASEGIAEPLKAEVEASCSRTRVLSTEGVDTESLTSSFTLISSCKRGDSARDDYFSSVRFLDRAHDVGASAAEQARAGDGAKPLDYSGRILLHQDVIEDFFATSVMQNLNGEYARRGKSVWAGKIGERVTGGYDLIDDPTIPWAIGTAGADDEGVPTKRRTLIKRGMLKSLIYDTHAACLSGTESTGNGFRADFSAMPHISPTNMIIEPAHRTKTRDGLFVRELVGFHNMNHTTGDFSLDIEAGSLAGKPIRGCMLIGNIFAALKDGDWVGPSITRGAFTSPMLAFEGKVVKG